MANLEKTLKKDLNLVLEEKKSDHPNIKDQLRRNFNLFPP